MRYLTKKNFSILLGNALDNFDTSIYSFLAPLLGPVFFPKCDPVVQLILTYSVLLISFFARPVGAFVFGVLAHKRGPVFCLSHSLIGVAFATVYTGFLPSYNDIGYLAPLTLVLLRIIKGIFAAGESTIAKLYLMEDKNDHEAQKISHLYQSSSMLGTILASSVATLVIAFHPEAWRFCFLLGGITGFMGYFLRKHLSEKRKVEKQKTRFEAYKISNFKTIWYNRPNIFRVAIATGFGHITYSIPFVFMNSFIPLITTISLETMMVLNTTLLVFDMLMIPFLGRFLIKFRATTVMMTASIILSLTIIPLFAYLPNASLEYVIFVRIWIVFWGVIFLCPLNFWFKSLFDSSNQYLLVGIGTALGASSIGRITTPFCLWLWHVTNLSVTPSLYIALLMFATVCAIHPTQKRKALSYQKI